MCTALMVWARLEMALGSGRERGEMMGVRYCRGEVKVWVYRALGIWFVGYDKGDEMSWGYGC